MRNSVFFSSILSIIALGCTGANQQQAPQQAAPVAPAAEATQQAASAPKYPPAVHVGEVFLVCDIDSTRNGSQKLTLTKGGGIEFDATVSPIVDGTVALKGPQNGGSYQFTSHLATPAKGTLSGIGEIEIFRMETKVSVAVDRYKQPQGPGTAFSFKSNEMADKGIYLEFMGLARASDGKEYAFRINLGSATSGEGKVTPADTMDNSRIMTKRVVVQAPSQAVIEAVTEEEMNSIPASTSIKRTK